MEGKMSEKAQLKSVLFSGYIRNIEALRSELNIAETDGVSAVLERGYARWGQDICAHLYGAFSFVLREEQSGNLFCARDQLGLNPLFYHLTESGKLLVSEDIRVIARHPEYHKKLNRNALVTYLVLGYPAGNETLFEGIRKLPAGHFLTYQNGEVSLHRYYRLQYRPDFSRTEEEWIREIERTARDIIAEDQQDCHFDGAESLLSGGVDSSYLLALNGLPDACSIGYEDFENYDESHLAQQTAAALGRNLHKCMITAEQYFDALPHVIEGMGLPLADASSVAFYLGCQNIAERTSMCFSGEGADEFFAGYRIYRLADKLAQEGGAIHCGCYGIMEESDARALLKEPMPRFPGESLVREIYADTAEGEHLSRLLAIDVDLYLEGNIMFALSRSSAVNGLQMRTPLADRRMFELAARIPSEWKLRNGVGKYILRQAAERVLPTETAHRPKVGFAVPMAPWMHRADIEQEIKSVLFGESSKRIFCQQRLALVCKMFDNGDDTVWSAVFAVYVFLLWYDMWFGEQKPLQ